MPKDKTLVCKDCGSQFTFSAREQDFYAEKGFTNDPSRCPDCRSARKQKTRNTQPRKMHQATCASCGAQAEVPFEPSPGRPVYCRDCYQPARKRGF